ncbi:MAG: tRNA (guanosine(37)-N1)-methyltransferase TrmD [Mollicutes bacterium]|nr:tRNA (guanosine(37)-N1)-methyltransferase TrmD [Mollicutes bacterium]MDD7264578.1 tRNA (guanosine(37)-N1)-methyltransferase TrmD [bacterium]MDY4979309.1 tRNA (guanosine(37)-N1)-methyltransferase TrmD [Candidatus Onthovivens sp.]
MKFIVLTLFKEMYDNFLSNSIIARAISKGLIEVKLVNIRDYTKDKYHRVDTAPIGGGAGLIMKAQPIYDALINNSNPNTYKIIMDPKGHTFNQSKAIELSKKEEILILCGHYEGIDARINKYFDEEISIGDFILTGGELASMCIIDSVSRLINGVISEESIVEETFNSSLLEYPQYTEPYDFNGDKVPDILYSGNHKEIYKYRQYQRLTITKKYRPDLYNKYNLTKEDIKILKERENNIQTKKELEAINKGKKFIKSK